MLSKRYLSAYNRSIYCWVDIYAYHGDADISTLQDATEVGNDVLNGGHDLKVSGNVVGVHHGDVQSIALRCLLLSEHAVEEIDGALDGVHVDLGEDGDVRTSDVGNIDWHIKARDWECAGVQGSTSCEGSEAGDNGSRGTHLEKYYNYEGFIESDLGRVQMSDCIREAEDAGDGFLVREVPLPYI